MPENRTGKGERSLREAMRREAMESPETSPATMKTLNSPSLAAISIGGLNLAWFEDEKEEEKVIRVFGEFNFHFVLNNEKPNML